MDRLTFSVTSLLVALIFVGCYTQIGYYEPQRPTRQTSHHRPDKNKRLETEHEQQAQVKTEEEAQIEAESEKFDEEYEGYYGRRKPTYGDYEPYYSPYYYEYYPTHPYYGGYYSGYPYHGYRYYPYYGGSAYHYNHSGRRPRYREHSRYHSRIGNSHFGRGGSQNHRGVRSSRPASMRPSKSSMTGKSSKAPARSLSGSRYHKLQRSERRH